MKTKIKIYLDTSVISALFDDRNQDRKQVTEGFFATIDKFDPYISSITIAEMNRSPSENLKGKMLDRVKNFSILETNGDIDSLAKCYIKQGAVPKKFHDDAYHIAFAVVHKIDYLLSWNLKHVVRQKTRKIVNEVNAKNNYRNVAIITPAELS